MKPWVSRRLRGYKVSLTRIQARVYLQSLNNCTPCDSQDVPTNEAKTTDPSYCDPFELLSG